MHGVYVRQGELIGYQNQGGWQMQRMVIKLMQSSDRRGPSDQGATPPKTYPDQQLDTQALSIRADEDAISWIKKLLRGGPIMKGKMENLTVWRCKHDSNTTSQVTDIQISKVDRPVN